MCPGLMAVGAGAASVQFVNLSYVWAHCAVVQKYTFFLCFVREWFVMMMGGGRPCAVTLLEAMTMAPAPRYRPWPTVP